MRNTHFKRTPEKGTSIVPCVGNTPWDRQANVASSVTIPETRWAGGGDSASQSAPTLYLMAGAPSRADGAITDSVALSCCAWNNTNSVSRLIGLSLMLW